MEVFLSTIFSGFMAILMIACCLILLFIVLGAPLWGIVALVNGFLPPWRGFGNPMLTLARLGIIAVLYISVIGGYYWVGTLVPPGTFQESKKP